MHLKQIVGASILHAAHAADEAEASCWGGCAQVDNDVSKIAAVRKAQIPAVRDLVAICMRKRVPDVFKSSDTPANRNAYHNILCKERPRIILHCTRQQLVTA